LQVKTDDLNEPHATLPMGGLTDMVLISSAWPQARHPQPSRAHTAPAAIIRRAAVISSPSSPASGISAEPPIAIADRPPVTG
jgi:hypothetical protein